MRITASVIASFQHTGYATLKKGAQQTKKVPGSVADRSLIYFAQFISPTQAVRRTIYTWLPRDCSFSIGSTWGDTSYMLILLLSQLKKKICAKRYTDDIPWATAVCKLPCVHMDSVWCRLLTSAFLHHGCWHVGMYTYVAANGSSIKCIPGVNF